MNKTNLNKLKNDAHQELKDSSQNNDCQAFVGEKNDLNLRELPLTV